MTAREAYPGIRKAFLEIAYDNGGINRFRSEVQQGREVEAFLARQPDEILGPIDEWLSSLSDKDLNTVCCDCTDNEEAQALLREAPPFTDQLLNDYFDEVC